MDAKTRIFDVCLTNKGRNLLSKNQLNFSYFAFSDDGIDYSGSIDYVASSASLSGTLDDFVHTNTFAFEPLRIEDKAVNNFLFTMPLQSEVVTRFDSSVTGSLSLSRKFSIESLENIVSGAEDIEKLLAQGDVLDYVIVVEETLISKTIREENHVKKQFERDVSSQSLLETFAAGGVKTFEVKNISTPKTSTSSPTPPKPKTDAEKLQEFKEDFFGNGLFGVFK